MSKQLHTQEVVASALRRPRNFRSRLGNFQAFEGSSIVDEAKFVSTAHHQDH